MSFWKSLAKGVLTVGGNILAPGVGTAAGGLFDAAVPDNKVADTTDTEGVDPAAQEAEGTDWGELGGAAFGAVGGSVAGLLKPQESAMQQATPSIQPQFQQDEQRRLQERYKFMRGQYGNVQ